MTPRLLKQLSYGVLFVAVIGVFLVGVHYLFFRTSASCFDNVRNQNEQGVDCGGVCTAACIPTGSRSPEIVGDVSAFSADGATLELVAKVQNPNTDVAARSFSYVFRITDTAGAVFEVPGMSYLYAGEIRYLEHLGPMPLGLNISQITKTELVITDPVWVVDASFRRPRFRLQQEHLSMTGDNIQISGTVVNDDTVPFDNLKVIVVLFGSLGNRIGVSETTVDALQTNESRTFTVIHPALTDLNPAITEIVVTAERL